MIEEFLKNLSEEVDYQFGTPWRYSEKTLGVVVPILMRGEAGERGYITLEEAKDAGVTFKDTGRIDRVIIESSVGKPIFIRSGTALKGGTQPRAVESSLVVVPKLYPETPVPIKQEIPVRCVFASRPILKGEPFHYAGYVPREVGSALLFGGGQGKVWGAVTRSTSRLTSEVRFRSSTRSDDLVGVMEEVDKFTSNIEEILKNVPLFENQVGAVFLDMKDIAGLEMFDHPKSWEAIHKEVEKRLGEASVKEQDSFFKPDFSRIKPLTLEFLKKLVESEKTEVAKHEMVSTISLKGDGVVGEATTINGKVIHLVGMKVEKSEAVKGSIGEMTRRGARISMPA